MKRIKFRRFGSYLIDIFIVSLLVMLISKINFINPYASKYKETYENYSEYYLNLIDGETELSVDDLLNDEYAGYVRDLSLYSITNILTEVVVIILYFTLFPKFNNNQTIGKRLLKIKVEHIDGKDIKLYTWFIRSLLIPICANIIFYNVITSILNVGIVLAFKGTIYLYANLTLTYIICLYCYADIMVSYIRKDNRTLHDLICKTKVVKKR